MAILALHELMQARTTGVDSRPEAERSLSQCLFLFSSALAVFLACVSLPGCGGYAVSNTQSVGSKVLSPSTTSIDFGNVSVGSSSTLSVIVKNTGTAPVSASQTQISGASFALSSGTPLSSIAAGQSVTLQIQFAPSSAGSFTGSLSVTSDAANSPTAVSLTGTGTSQTASGLLACGKSGDSSNHVPSNWGTFLPPAKGQSYVDPTFGCTVTRITDSSKEIWTGSFFLPISHGYSTVSPFNANDTYMLLVDGWNRHFVTDLKGNILVPVSNMPSSVNDGWFLWDATNSSVFYFTKGNSLMKGTISGSSVTTSTLHQFAEYAAINFMDATDVSQDGSHVVIIGGDNTGSSPEDVFVYDFVANSKGAVYTTSCRGVVNNVNNACLHKLIQAPDNHVIIQFPTDGTGPEQGNRLWSGLTPLPGLQDATNHLDVGYDLNGNPVFVEVGNSSTLSTLPGITNPCPSGWGLDVRQIYNPLSAVCLLDHQPSWHVGYRGNKNQPWVGLSFFDKGRTPSPEWFDSSSNYAAPAASNWQSYEDEIMLVRIDANNNSNLVYRLALAYSRSNEDFVAQPHAAISRDGHYIAFTSNMAYAHTGCPSNFQTSTNCTDVYVIKVQ